MLILKELFKWLDPIEPKINIYVEYATHVQKQFLARGVSVVDATNLVDCGVGVEDMDVDDDDNEVDVEDGDKALADDEFKEGGNLVDEGNDARSNDGNGAGGDVDYEWYDSDYDDTANEKLYES